MLGGIKMHYLLTFIISVILTRNAYAQNSPVESTAYQTRLKSGYYQQNTVQSRLYNGIKYVEYSAYYIGNGFFNTNSFQNTTLYYDGSKFDNIPALYDMYRELVVIRYKDTSDKISLINAKLDSFNMSGHQFIRIDAGTSIKPGFYEQLYNGKTQLLKKYTVDIEDDKSQGVTRHQFYQSKTLYVLRNSAYKSISGGSALLSLLKDKRKQLNEYLSANKLNSRLTGEDMVKLLLYYDKLNG